MDKLNTIFVFVSIRPIFSYKMYVLRVCVCVWLCRVREHNLLFCDRRTSFVSLRKNSVYDKVSNVTKCKRKHILTECELMKSFDMNGKWFSSSAMFYVNIIRCNAIVGSEQMQKMLLLFNTRAFPLIISIRDCQH